MGPAGFNGRSSKMYIANLAFLRRCIDDIDDIESTNIYVYIHVYISGDIDTYMYIDQDEDS